MAEDKGRAGSGGIIGSLLGPILGEANRLDPPNITTLKQLERMISGGLFPADLEAMRRNPAFLPDLGDVAAIGDVRTILKKGARRKLDLALKSRAEAQLRQEGATSPSEEEIQARVDANFSGDLSIADLKRLEIDRREQFTGIARKKMGDRRLFSGKRLKSVEDLSTKLGLEEALDENGNPVLDVQREGLGMASMSEQRLTGDPSARAFENLLKTSTNLINEGAAILGGDLSGGLAQDSLLNFGRIFDQGFRGAGSARFGGGAALNRTIGSRLAALEMGGVAINQGLGLMGASDPFSIPETFFSGVQAARGQTLFNDQLGLGIRRQDEAARLAVHAADQSRRQGGAQNLLGLKIGDVNL